MKINEVVEDQLEYIRDLLVYLRVKNVDSVSTNSVLAELEKSGIATDYEELEPLITQFDFIDDISEDEIVFKTAAEKSIQSDEKIDMDKEAVSSMARRARKQRENR